MLKLRFRKEYLIAFLKDAELAMKQTNRWLLLRDKEVMDYLKEIINNMKDVNEKDEVLK